MVATTNIIFVFKQFCRSVQLQWRSIYYIKSDRSCDTLLLVHKFTIRLDALAECLSLNTWRHHAPLWCMYNKWNECDLALCLMVDHGSRFGGGENGQVGWQWGERVGEKQAKMAQSIIVYYCVTCPVHVLNWRWFRKQFLNLALMMSVFKCNIWHFSPWHLDNSNWWIFQPARHWTAT